MRHAMTMSGARWARTAVCVWVAAGFVACSSGSGGGGVFDGGSGGSAGFSGTPSGGAAGIPSGGNGGQSGAGGCKLDGQICAGFAECCSGTCTQGRCGGVPCVEDGAGCSVFGDCCSGSCVQGTCTTPVDAGPGYPPGPYGINVGDVIENATFDGYADFFATRLSKISFSDFYNPTDSPQQPRLLVIAMMAMGSGPDQMQEQQTDASYWNSNRVEFIGVFAWGFTLQPATESDLATWASSFDPSSHSHPLQLDPDFSQLNAFFVASGQSVPYNIVVDARSMKIVDLLLGAQLFDSSHPVLNAELGL
jgi:hypothetical protein